MAGPSTISALQKLAQQPLAPGPMLGGSGPLDAKLVADAALQQKFDAALTPDLKQHALALVDLSDSTTSPTMPVATAPSSAPSQAQRNCYRVLPDPMAPDEERRQAAAESRIAERWTVAVLAPMNH